MLADVIRIRLATAIATSDASNVPPDLNVLAEKQWRCLGSSGIVRSVRIDLKEKKSRSDRKESKNLLRLQKQPIMLSPAPAHSLRSLEYRLLFRYITNRILYVS